MAFSVLRTDADDCEPRGLNVRVQVANRTGLTCTAGSEIGRVEVQDQRTCLEQAFERDIVSLVVSQDEPRSLAASFQHQMCPSFAPWPVQRDCMSWYSVIEKPSLS